MDNNTGFVELADLAARLPAVMHDVGEGREFIITDHGKEFARLVPQKQGGAQDLDALITCSRAIAQRSTLDGITIQELRDAGKKW